MHEGKSVGAFTEDQIMSMLEAGVLKKTTLVWTQSQNEWKTIEEAFGLNETPPPLPQAPHQALQDSVRRISSWSDTTPHPWRRYFAKLLDTIVNGSLAFFFLAVVLYVVDAKLAQSLFDSFDDKNPGGKALDVMATSFIAILPNAVLLGLTGTTLGKWFFGIKVLNADDTPVGFLPALEREFRVWIFGFGLGIPLVNIITMSRSYDKLKKNGITRWDEALHAKVTYRPTGTKQTLLYFAGFFCWLVAYSCIIALSKM